MPTKPELPRTPTRERRVYLASARIYVNLFRAVFTAPLQARRIVRKLAEGRSPDAALDALWQRPETFGTQRTSATHVHDPAFVYWTQRARRPRALLKRAAAAIARELSRREHYRLVEEDRRAKRLASEEYNAALQTHLAWRRTVVDVLRDAERVYVHPHPAARAILRATRIKGAAAVLHLVKTTPEHFGPLLVNRVPVFRDVPILRNWDWLMGFQRDTHERALGFVPRLTQTYTAAVTARTVRTKPGPTRILQHRSAAADFQVFRMERANTALEGGLKEAAELIAILLRRRAIDEQPEGDKGPPAITTQLAAMLPARAKQLIDDAVHMAEKESGDEYEGWRLERTRGRGREGGGWERERSRGWDMGR